MPCRFSCSDDPHQIFILAVGIGVDHDEDRNIANHSDRMPALLAVFERIGQDDMQGVIPNQFCQLESHAMLGKVASRFFRIANESQKILILTIM